MNQELEGVNSELLASVVERDQAHSDLLQLFSSNPNPMIFLDDKLRIRQFTPSAVEVFHLLPGDRGRPLDDIRSRLSGMDLPSLCGQVCQTRKPREAMLCRNEPDSPPRTFQIRILPYLGVAGRLDGILLNFIDITELQQSKEQAQRRERQLTAVTELGTMISREKDLDRVCRKAVRILHRMLSVDAVCLLHCPRDEHAEFFCAQGTQPVEHPHILGLSAISQTLTTGRTVTFSGPPQQESHGKPPSEGESDPICSGVTTGISEDQEFPWLLCALHRKPRNFAVDEVDFIESIADLLSNAMARSKEHFLNALDRVIAGALGHPQGFSGAKQELLTSLATELEASFCELWLPDPLKAGELSRYASASGDHVDPMYNSGETTVAAVPAEGLICKVWEARAPVWVAAQHVADVPEKRPDAIRPELSSGFALPLLSGQERLGVLCCFLPRRRFYSSRLIASLSIAGLSLGEFLRRSRAEAALKDSEKSLFQALKAVPFPLCIIDDGLAFQLVSDMAYQLTGFEPGELASVEDWAAKLSRRPEAREAIRNAALTAIDSLEVVHHGVVEVQTKAGQRALWDFTTAPLMPTDGGRRRMVAVAYDVSEREANRKQLEEASLHKDAFLAMLGHELRNPLAVIRNGVQLIGMADSQTERDDVMGIIDRQSSQMALLIDGLLDLNRISLGKVSLDPVPLNLTRLARTLTDDKRGLFEAKGLELLFEPGPTPAWSRSDRVRMNQVLENLLGNSLKFIEAPGSVKVSLAVDSQWVKIKVKDTGQGMTPELAAVAFEPFRQGEQTLARPHGGLGLGLSLVKQIVELHGGTVEVHSEGLGRGCEFEISLVPCPPGDEEEAEAVTTEIAPWSILYVEDDVDLAVSLGRLLEAAGHEVRHAMDAKVALDLVAARPPQVILCDLGLAGDVDGYGLLEQFQMLDSLRDVPVVAITGYGLAADKARVRSAGFAAHLTKPFEIHDLQRLLRDLPRPRAGKLPRPDFCRILVVDDNLMIAQGTARMLAKSGFEARFAVSGAEALRVAAEQSPHLALLDLGLPDCDGPQLKEKLAGLPECQQCVYLAVTGSDDPADIARTTRAGFAAHLVKPVSLARLLAEFERIALAVC